MCGDEASDDNKDYELPLECALKNVCKRTRETDNNHVKESKKSHRVNALNGVTRIRCGI